MTTTASARPPCPDGPGASSRPHRAAGKPTVRRRLGMWRFLVHTRGGAAVEMALVTPVLVALLFGTIDVGWRLLAEYRLAKAAATLAHLVARARELGPSDMANAFAALPALARPFDLRVDGAAIVSGIEADGGGSGSVVWQQRSPWGIATPSVFGGPGAWVPGDVLQLQPGEAVVAAEVILRFRAPVGLVLPGEREIRRLWFAAPRYGALDDPSS